MDLRPKKYISKVTNTSWVSPKVISLELSCENPANISFLPGQFISVKVASDTYRAYSIASDPEANGSISLIAEVKHEGLGSEYIKGLNVGDIVEFIGPSGSFVFRPTWDRKILFVATGTGIAPFISMLYEIQKLGLTQKVLLLFGVRYEDEILFYEELKKFKEMLPNFDYKICISQPNEVNYYLSGRVTIYLKKVDLNNTDIYLCGHPEMIYDAKKYIKSTLFQQYNLFEEEFTHN